MLQKIIRSQVTLTFGLLALSITAQLAQAQSCTPGLGMTTSDLLFGKWSRPSVAADFTIANGQVRFGKPTAVLASSPGHAFVIDDGQGVYSLSYTPATSSSPAILNGTLNSTLTSVVAMAWDSAILWTVNSSGQLRGASIGQVYSLAGTTLPDGGVGSMIYDGTYLWISHPNGSHPGTLTKVLFNNNTGFTTTQVAVTGLPLSTAGLQALTFDGQYLWASTTNPVDLVKIDPSTGKVLGMPGAANLLGPYALAFDGYSIWAADGTTVSRFSQITTAHNGTYNAGDARSLAFDGVQMWVAERNASSIVPIRACDGISTMKPITTPLDPEYVAFDGKYLWVTSPTSRTVSIR